MPHPLLLALHIYHLRHTIIMTLGRAVRRLSSLSRVELPSSTSSLSSSSSSSSSSFAAISSAYSRPLSDHLLADKRVCWHPYSSALDPPYTLPVASAQGATISLESGESMVDAMSSWWSAVHGYNHPVLNDALKTQCDSVSHVMFGGLTHRPAVALCEGLSSAASHMGETRVFLADSGSVSIDVALKMCAQATGKAKVIAVGGGYHGDTVGAMGIGDSGGMHGALRRIVQEQVFVMKPSVDVAEDDECVRDLERAVESNKGEVAAIVLEPVVQGAGGMRFYDPEYLRIVRDICDRNGLLMVADEIASGFGRGGGSLWQTEDCGVSPDIMCVGKALTGGYMTLAAVVAKREVADAVSKEGGPLMHGPTFMGNPLACAVGCASLDLLMRDSEIPGTPWWLARVTAIESQLVEGLRGVEDMDGVEDVRVKGAIGVIEMSESMETDLVAKLSLTLGVWLRPFGKLLYTMPPYICTPGEVRRITDAMKTIAELHTEGRLGTEVERLSPR